MQIKQADSDSLQEENNYHIKETSFYDTVRKNLPFSLTNGQEHALNEIQSDFLKPYITQRLIQGDVGSGKTLIAFLSMLLFAENGYQSLIMAPTEVLARQHYQTFCEYISQYQLPFSCVLLTGSITGKNLRAE